MEIGYVSERPARSRRDRLWRWLTVGGLLVAPLTLAACGGSTCSSRGATESIVGRLVARQGSTATFFIESVQPPTISPSSGHPPPVLEPGQTVAVQYYGGTAKFLHVGKRYSVALFWVDPGHFESAVHTADDRCSWGTVYADGHAIDTRTWARAHLGEIVLGIALVVLAVFGIFAASLRALARVTRGKDRPRPSRRTP